MASQETARMENVIARLERIPFSFWHVKMRAIVGIATFFDAFNSVTIAYVLPVLIPLWNIAPTGAGLLISTGYLGQLVGAVLFGILAERIGRVKSLTLSVAILGFMSLACFFSQNYTSLLIFRFIQGLGLGGEVPIAATYINELSRAESRGRFTLLYQLVFVMGMVAASLVGFWVVPRFGWRYLFLIGVLPAFALPLFLRFLPESPRWLVSHKRLGEAENVVQRLEEIVSAEIKEEMPPVGDISTRQPVQKKTDWRELFQGIYLRRTLTVWVIWFSAYFVTYGLTTWLPSLYSSVFELPLEQSLKFGLITNAAGLLGSFVSALVIDRIGRKAWFTGAFLGGAIFLLLLWNTGTANPYTVLIYVSLSYMFIASISLALYLYSPEIYPTRIRALGSSVGSAWLRIASTIGPYVVGVIVAQHSLGLAFAMFGVVSLLGAVITGIFAIETKGRVLEEISP